MSQVYLCKVYKMGNKFGMYFKKELLKSINIKNGESVNITFTKNEKSFSYITQFSSIISFRKELLTALNINKDEVLSFKIEKILKNKVENSLIIKNNKIDLFYLVPNETNKGSKIVSTPFFKNNEEWLRLWSYHKRGSSQQIEVRRFLDINLFGKFLGQLQSEGTKNGDGKRLEFCNKSIKEHNDFIFYLNNLGIDNNKILVKFNYNPKSKYIEPEIKKFEDLTGLKIDYRAKNPQSKGNFGFHTFVRSTLLYSFIINSLKIVRKELTKEKWNGKHKILADGFLAKVLSGDGDIELITKNRKTPQARIKITDGNNNHLKEYKIIMEKYGFKPKINEKFHYVRSYLNNSLISILLSISAFEGNKNRDKIDALILSRFPTSLNVVQLKK